MTQINARGVRTGMDLVSKLLVVKNTFLELVNQAPMVRRPRRARTDSELHCNERPGLHDNAQDSSSELDEGSPRPQGPQPNQDEVVSEHVTAAVTTSGRSLEPVSTPSGSASVYRPHIRGGLREAPVARAGCTSVAPPLAAVGRALQQRKTTTLPWRRQDKRTTVMLRNVPNNYTRAMLFEMLDTEGFNGQYDFVYLPTDFKSRAGLGYAFVNLVDSSVVPRFWATFNGYSRWVLPTTKVCQVSWSKPYQGLHANVQRYRNSSVMHADVPEECKPCVFVDGVRTPFPSPTKVLQPPCNRSPLA